MNWITKIWNKLIHPGGGLVPVEPEPPLSRGHCPGCFADRTAEDVRTRVCRFCNFKIKNRPEPVTRAGCDCDFYFDVKTRPLIDLHLTTREWYGSTGVPYYGVYRCPSVTVGSTITRTGK